MSKYLGTSQPTVHRLENGQREPGPIARLLDSLEASLSSSDPPSGAFLFCAPDTSSPPAEPQSDRANGEDLSFPSMVWISPTIVLDGLVTLGGPAPTSEPEDAP